MSEHSTDVTVAICTRNRADSLRETLRSMQNVSVPENWEVDLLVIDNGSTDHTLETVREAHLPQFDVRVVEESRPGLSHARNTAFAEAYGDILLFTDDDVRVPEDWVTGMTKPIREDQADAVVGGVELAPHLQRSWQAEDPWLTSPLATTHAISTNDPERIVGANMAIARPVFEQLPPFDTELDPGGRLALGGDTLFSLQLKDAGFRLVAAFDATVEHHCDPSRLSRESYLDFAEKIGRSQGFIDYHWHQRTVHPAQLLAELGWRYAKLAAGYVLRHRDTQAAEGLRGWEMVLLTQIYHRRQLLAERGRPRKYAGQAKQPSAKRTPA